MCECVISRQNTDCNYAASNAMPVKVAYFDDPKWPQVLAHWPDHLCGQEPPIVTARPNQSAQIQSIRPPHKSNQSQLKFSIPYQHPPGYWGWAKPKSYMMSDPPIKQDRFHKCNKCITNLSYHQIHRVKLKHQMMEHTNASYIVSCPSKKASAL